MISIKNAILAVALISSVGLASAQGYGHHGHRDHQAPAPQVSVEYMNEGRLIFRVTTTRTCVRFRHGECRRWQITRQRELVRDLDRRGRHHHRHGDGRY